jgi:hypothetical protein
MQQTLFQPGLYYTPENKGEQLFAKKENSITRSLPNTL